MSGPARVKEKMYRGKPWSEHYLKYVKPRFEERKAAVEKLKTGPCADCRQHYPPCVLEFDHVRGKKKFKISEATSSTYAFKHVVAEIAKCDLVCANCHRLRHFARRQEGL